MTTHRAECLCSVCYMRQLDAMNTDPATPAVRGPQHLTALIPVPKAVQEDAAHMLETMRRWAADVQAQLRYEDRLTARGVNLALWHARYGHGHGRRIACDECGRELKCVYTLERPGTPLTILLLGRECYAKAVGRG